MNDTKVTADHATVIHVHPAYVPVAVDRAPGIQAPRAVPAPAVRVNWVFTAGVGTLASNALQLLTASPHGSKPCSIARVFRLDSYYYGPHWWAHVALAGLGLWTAMSSMSSADVDPRSGSSVLAHCLAAGLCSAAWQAILNWL